MTNSIILNEYRFVRRHLYPAQTPDEAMQGHYIRAASLEEAVKKMREVFPTDNAYSGKLWKEPVNNIPWRR